MGDARVMAVNGPTHSRFLLQRVIDEGEVHVLPVFLILFDSRICGNGALDEKGR